MPIPSWLSGILSNTEGGTSGAAGDVPQDVVDWVKEAMTNGSDANKELMDLLKENFNQQFSYLADKQAMFNRYSQDLLKTIKNAPEYAIPDIIKNTTETLGDYANKVKDAYTSGAQDVKEDIRYGVEKAITAYTQNVSKSIDAVKSAGGEGIDAYQGALQSASNTSGAILDTAYPGFKDALNTYNSLAQQGLSGFDKNTADAVKTYASGASTIEQLSKQVTPQMLDAAQKAADVYKQGGADVVSGYQKSAEAIRGTAGEYAGKMGEYTQKATESQLTGAKGMLDVYGDLARQKELPGQRLIEEKLGSSTADAIRRIREMGGGEAGALQAVGGVYSKQNQQLQDLASQAAQYRTDRQADYANAIQQASAMQANAYGNQANMAGQQANLLTGAETTAQGMVGGAQERMMANQAGAYGNLAGQLGQTLGAVTGAQSTATQLEGGAQQTAAQQTAQNYLQASGLLGGAGMDYTQALNYAQSLAGNMNINAQQAAGTNYNQYANMLGNTYMNAGNMVGGANMQGAQTIGGANQTAANMVGQGYTTAAGMNTDAANLYQNAYDTQFGYNQYNPWAQQVNYYQNQQSMANPTNAYMQLMGDQAGVYLGMMNANTQTQNTNNQGLLNTFGNFLNTYANPANVMPTFMGGGG